MTPKAIKDASENPRPLDCYARGIDRITVTKTGGRWVHIVSHVGDQKKFAYKMSREEFRRLSANTLKDGCEMTRGPETRKPEASTCLKLIQRYRMSVKSIKSWKEKHVPEGTKVHVSNDRYHGEGVVVRMADSPHDGIIVRLENGNDHTYPLEDITP